MVLASKRFIGLAGLVVMLLLTVGCSPTRVSFDGPPGTVMTVDNKIYHLPAQIEMMRPAGTGDSFNYGVSLVFTSHDSKEVRASGEIKVYGYNESDVDRVATNTCNLDEAQLVKVLDGVALVFKAQTASRQPLFDLTLGKP